MLVSELITQTIFAGAVKGAALAWAGAAFGGRSSNIASFLEF
jgi:hypothetical protein